MMAVARKAIRHKVSSGRDQQSTKTCHRTMDRQLKVLRWHKDNGGGLPGVKREGKWQLETWDGASSCLSKQDVTNNGDGGPYYMDQIKTVSRRTLHCGLHNALTLSPSIIST